MQNVVDVACSSPPVVMNATRPAAQAVQAADRDPFDLVLQKASERIVNDKQSDRAGKSSDSKSTENTSGSDSTANKKVAESNTEREVNQTNKADNTDKPEKTGKLEKTEKSEIEEISTQIGDEPESSIIAYAFITPETTVTENEEKIGVAGEVSSEEIVPQAVEAANLLQIANPAPVTSITPPVEAVQSASVISTYQAIDSAAMATIAADQTGVVATNGSGTIDVEANPIEATGAKPIGKQESSVETDPKITFSETLKSESKVGDNSKNESKPEALQANQTITDGGKVTGATTTTNPPGHVVDSVAGKNQETTSSVAASVAKNEKPATDTTRPDVSPPDTPDGTASVTVQTTSKISEPARLAEAPKNEVINQVANQVDQMVKTNRSSLRMQLYPEELGHIDLRIVTTKDGISVTMVTEKASTQQVLKSDMDVLRQNIEQAGIQLTNLNINQGQNSNRQQAFEHRQNFSNSYPGSSSDNSNSASNEPKKHLTSTVVDYKV